jgi:hypothetical protein
MAQLLISTTEKLHHSVFSKKNELDLSKKIFINK